MRGVLLGVLLAAGLASGDESLAFHRARYTCAPLEFKVALPEAWEVEHDRAQLVAHGNGMGFRISREPFLGDPKTFENAWGALLAEAGLDAELDTTRAGRYKAFHAAYTWGEGRAQRRIIRIWRLYVEDGEWLYNISFSVPDGVDPEPLEDGVLDSFSYIGGEPKPELEDEPIRIGRFCTLNLPEGYEKVERKRGKRPMPFFGGDGSIARFAKPMPGYVPPREAGRITLYAFNHRMGYKIGGANVSGADLDAMTDSRWTLVSDQITTLTKKGRGRTRRGGDFKGRLFTASGYDRDGNARSFFAFGFKERGVTIVVALFCDERELRLHKNLFKDMLKTLREPE